MIQSSKKRKRHLTCLVNGKIHGGFLEVLDSRLRLSVHVLRGATPTGVPCHRALCHGALVKPLKKKAMETMRGRG